MNPFLTDTLAAIRAEAEATKPVYMASSAAVAELIAERVERGILSRAEAVVIFDHLAAEYHAAAGLPDCACCGMNFYRTADGGCTYCVTAPDGSRPICCRS